MPTRSEQRELLLHNLLARSALLCHRAAIILSQGSPVEQCLAIEIHSWFSEARESLSSWNTDEARNPPEATPTLVQSAGNSGGYWKPPTTPTDYSTTSHPLAKSTEPPTAEEVPISKPSSGGSTPGRGKTSSTISPSEWFGMRL